MLKRLSAFFASLLLSLSSLFVLATPVARAATITWDGDGGDSNLSTPGNWVGGDVPTVSDDVVFDTESAAGNLTLVNDLIGRTFRSITFVGEDAEDSFTINGPQLLIVTNGITNESATTQTLNLPIQFNGAQSIDADSGSIVFGGVLSGSGALTKTGNSSVSLNAANTFTGTMTVSQGVLGVGHSSALGGTGSGTIIADGGGLAVGLPDAQKTATISEPLTFNAATVETEADEQGAWFSDGACGTFGAATCEGTNITYAGAITLGAHVKVSTFGGAMTITGNISGAYTLGMYGDDDGKITLNAGANTSQTPNGVITKEGVAVTIGADSNTPGQAITIGEKQTYIVNGTRGTTTVNSGGTLKGKGTVGATTINSGGTLAPGESPGCINTGNLTFNSGSTYEFEVGGTTACDDYDQTKVTGSVALGNSTLSVVLFNDFAPEAGQTYMIIDNDTAADPIPDTFNNLAEGAEVEVDGYVLTISYVGGDGNDVVLTVKTVPESPDTGFMLLVNNPLVTLGVTTTIAGALVVMSRKLRALAR